MNLVLISNSFFITKLNISHLILILTKKYGGTGLGLSIVKKLMDLMNGEIKVSSEMNKGTVFEIKIPVKI